MTRDVVHRDQKIFFLQLAMTTTQLLLAVALSVILPACAVVWLGLFARHRARGEFLPTETRSLVPWRAGHVAVAFFLYVVLPTISLFFVQQRFDIPIQEEQWSSNPDVITWLLAGDSLLKFLAVALILVFLRIDLAVTRFDLGWQSRRLKSDLLTGILAFVAIAPLVYLLQFVLKSLYNQFFDEQAAHPIETLIRENPTAGILFWSFFSAVIAAPLVEEFLFRVVLQGWLEKAFYRTRVLVGAELAAPANDSGAIVAGEIPPPFMWQPIILSSVTFSLLHVGHGPDPVPLFALALVLGYLYAKTHRILPCIVVHMALNGLSMLALWDGINEPVGWR